MTVEKITDKPIYIRIIVDEDIWKKYQQISKAKGVSGNVLVRNHVYSTVAKANGTKESLSL